MKRSAPNSRRRRRAVSTPWIFALPLTLLVLPPPSPLVRAQHLDGTTCRLVTLLPFTDDRPPLPPSLDFDDPSLSYGYGAWPNQEALAKASFSLLASAHMAVRHFNERDGRVVPELATELEGCDVTLEFGLADQPFEGKEGSWVFDSAYSRSKTVSQELPLVSSSSADDICAFLGPIDTRAHEGLSVLSENLDVPQLGFATIGQRLERTDDFPTFLRTIPAAFDFSARVATLVGRDVWRREYVAIIYDQSDYGEQFEDPLEDAEDDLGYATVTEHFVEGDPESLYGSLGEAKDKGFRTVLLVTDRPSFLDDVAEVADELGMLGGGNYMWILAGDAFPPAMRGAMRFEVDSPADKMLRGAALFTNYDPFVYNGEDDSFLASWRAQDESVAERAIASQPLDEDGNQFYVPNATTYFETETPTEYASYMYDSVIAAGIGACRGLALPSSGGNNHYRGIYASAFRGASGEFKFRTDANSRDPRGTLFGVHNVRPGAVDESGRRSYEAVLTATWDASYATNDRGEEVDGGWRTVPDAEFLFFDGTIDEPMPLRTVADAHELSDGVQTTGLVLSSVAVIACVATGAFVVARRKHKHIKSIQPEFCLLLCFGAALVAASLIFVSFDESDGLSEDQLDSLCTTAPWFFVVGYFTMFSALFTQLWRLSKVFSIRRQQVQIKQVMGPFALIILCSLIVLTVWTIIDPVVWVREPISGFDDEGGKNTDEPLETYGECQSENYGLVPFFSTLLFLISLVIGVTAVFSWKLKGVSTDFADSKLMFFGIFTHIQVWMLGVPILVITNSVSKDAHYLMMAALTFILSVSMVALVIWPKVYLYFRDACFGEPSPNRLGNICVGPTPCQVSGLTTSPQTIRVVELESQVSKLKIQLSEKEREIHRLSIRGVKPLGNLRDTEPTTTASRSKSEKDYEIFESMLNQNASCQEAVPEEKDASDQPN